MEASTNLGRVSLVPRGVYNPAEQYERLDIVEYSGSAYLALRPVQGVTPENGADYMLLAQGGRDGAPGADGQDGAPGADGSSIAGIERTSGSGAPGETDTYTITLTDGSTSTFQVYNGADGQGAGDMTQAVYDPQRRKTDIFRYVDEKLKDVPAPENLLKIPGGGEVEPPEGLGEGPYTIVLDETGGLSKAEEVSYDSGESGLEAGNVQTALDQLSAVKADAWRVSGRNLLHNWYFLDPVNQRGQTEYGPTRMYVIDRWEVLPSLIVRLVEKGITIYGQEGDGLNRFWQVCDAFVMDRDGDKIFTFSVLDADGNLHMCSGIPQGVGSEGSVNTITDFGNIYLFWTTNRSEANLAACITVSPGKSKTFVAAKLELGSVQTLAHQDADGSWVLNDPPPDKATELLKCQRYFVRFLAPGNYTQFVFLQAFTNSRAVSYIPLPVTMRDRPTIKADKLTVCGVFSNSAALQKLSCTLIARQVMANTMNIEVQSPDSLFVPENMYFLEFSVAGGYLDLDANL